VASRRNGLFRPTANSAHHLLLPGGESVGALRLPHFPSEPIRGSLYMHFIHALEYYLLDPTCHIRESQPELGTPTGRSRCLLQSPSQSAALWTGILSMLWSPIYWIRLAMFESPSQNSALRLVGRVACSRVPASPWHSGQAVYPCYGVLFIRSDLPCSRVPARSRLSDWYVASLVPAFPALSTCILSTHLLFTYLLDVCMVCRLEARQRAI
jgi:hypothetical protein